MKVTLSAIFVCGFAACCSLYAQESQIRVTQGAQVVEVQAMSPNIVRIHISPDGKTTPRTLVMDPALQPSGTNNVRLEKKGNVETLTSPAMRVIVNEADPMSVEVQDPQQQSLLTLKNDAGRRARAGGLVLAHDQNENLYGIHGMDLNDSGTGILRNTGGTVAAGAQGNAGAPFFFTKRYGVLVDSDGGAFQSREEEIHFTGSSRPDAEYFVIVGPPLKSMEGLATLTGKPAMPPKWTLGFLNSQWVSSEPEWLQIAKTYQQKEIPISGFILDFDWKAWGEDNYGEWRWNSTSGAGSHDPNKFPDGASGKFAADLLQEGIHLTGILKPRILINTVDGKPTEASAYATEHNFWYPNEKRENDYFTHRLAGNIDFNNPDARKWYWEHLEPAFHAGMTAWWNDEADEASSNIKFNNFQFMNMARALYEGQRSISPERVWSINRNYYVGAARYGYAEWSGDIDTGFQSMAYQRRRMISTLNLGESEWSMDTGGFRGHPTSENYARWMEFAAFVPVFRVHGTSNEKRQPWVYGEPAEAAAKRVMRLRYDLIPYIYSNARTANETGIGVVRPLFWVFPDDERTAEETSAWMFGDALLVSPIVEHGAAAHSFYLPQGTWLDYATGKPVKGGRDVSVPIDSQTWKDIPIYVREGSILATQPASGNDVSPKVPLVLDVFPSAARVASFVVYDDDGHTYAYEKGDYFRQEVAAKRAAGSTDITAAAATGTYKAQFPGYLLRIHQASAAVTGDGARMKKFASAAAFQASTEAGWFTDQDKFGPVTEVRVPWSDGKPHSVKLSQR